MNRKRLSGFSIIELSVALTAGLIVTLGIVALSREATRTFHEEVRASAAEATLRTAVDRLRADLQRAGFMSTGNLTLDPIIAGKTTTAASLPAGLSCTTFKTLCYLASVRLTNGGSSTQTPLSAIQSPALAPDMIDIGGNMTSVEQFEVQAVLPVGGASCQTIQLSQSSAAYARVVAAGASSTGPSAAGTQAVLTSMFQPDSASQFIVRLMDDTGHAQYLATCPTNPVGMNGNQAYVSVDARTPVLTAANTGNVGGVSGFGSGRAWVNPVQVVRWELVAASSGIEPAGFSAMAGESFGGNDAGIDPYKYDLIRSFVGMDNNRISATVDVVAEYAVDLDFAFSVETGTVALPSILTYAFGDANNAVAAGATYPYPQPGAVPERLRAVRVRLAARVAQPDRSRSVSLAAAAPYIYRYCVSATACAAVGDPNLPLWARARTITTEVSLPNLATDFF